MGPNHRSEGKDREDRMNSRDEAELERTALSNQSLGDGVGKDGDGAQLLNEVDKSTVQDMEPRRNNWF